MSKRKKHRKVVKHKQNPHIFLILFSVVLFVFTLTVIFANVNSILGKIKNKDMIIGQRDPNIGKNYIFDNSESLSKINPITYPVSYYQEQPTPAPRQVYTGYCLNVPVLTYHHIQPQAASVSLKQTSLSVDNGMFDQQMAYLVGQGYTAISALDLVEALRNHTGLPGKSVVITMDDGYADNDVYALPVLKKYNLRANLMLASGLVGSNSDMLSWGQVSDMRNSGLYYFTNHTWSHYSIANGMQSKIESEIDMGASQIKQNIGQDVNIFTYPYGSFNNNAIQTLQRKGYIGAFSTIPGHYQCDSFIMTLHRTRIGNAPLSYYGL